MPPPLVSVIIPTYNRKEKAALAVESVLAQGYSPVECIVVDDGSEDGSFEHLANKFNGRIRLFRQENTGVSAARNKGIKEAKGGFIAFLDSDDLWRKNKLSVQMEYLERHPEIKICQTTETWFRKGRRVNPPAVYRKIGGDIFEPSLKRCMVTPSSVLLKKELLDEVGLFNEGMPVCEDYDLWLRVCVRYPVGLIEKELLVRHGGSPDQLSARHSQDRYRIYALERLLNSGALDDKKRRAALKAFREKCRIYGTGCLKRGKKQEGARYLEMAGGEGEWK
jgi:glycosyltransferase involved in cell wall biosynthesis